MRLIEHDYFECEINRARGVISTLLAVGESRENICEVLTQQFNSVYYVFKNSIRREPSLYMVWAF